MLLWMLWHPLFALSTVPILKLKNLTPSTSNNLNLQLSNYPLQPCTRHQVSIYPSQDLPSITDGILCIEQQDPCISIHTYTKRQTQREREKEREKRHGGMVPLWGLSLTLRSLEIPSGLIGSHYEANRTEIITGRWACVDCSYSAPLTDRRKDQSWRRGGENRGENTRRACPTQSQGAD